MRRIPTRCSRTRSWHVAAPLDVDGMNAAAQHVVGEHDFASFCRRPKGLGGAQKSQLAYERRSPTLVRNVISVQWRSPIRMARCCASRSAANAFCHQMVRSIVGTLVDVGTGKLGSRRRAGDPRRPRPPGCRPGRAAARTDVVGSRLLKAVIMTGSAIILGLVGLNDALMKAFDGAPALRTTELLLGSCTGGRTCRQPT